MVVVVRARVFGQTLLALALFYAAIVSGQEPRPGNGRPARDTSAQPRRAVDPTAPAADAEPEAAPPFIARGRVVSADGVPLPRVRISVQADRPPEPVFADNQGRFEMIVPAASGGLRFTKAGYLAASISRRDAQTAGVTVQLVKGAAINGSVTGPSGSPAVGAPVRVRRAADSGSGGGGRGGAQYATDTDDLGQFRIGSLPAGRYTVSVGGLGIDGADRALIELLAGGNGGRGGLGALFDQLGGGAAGQVDLNALRDAVTQAAGNAGIDLGALQNALGQTGGNGRGNAPDGTAAGRGAPAGNGRGAAPANGRARGTPDPAAQAGVQAGGQGNGRGGQRGRGRGEPAPVNPNDAVVELVAGQESSVGMIYEAPAATALPQIQSLLDQVQTRLQLARSGTQAQAQAATGIIRGRVFNADGTPLKGASVQVTSVDGTGRRTGTTDESGRYEVTAVQAGRYRVRATKSGLVAVEFGQTRAQQPGRILEVGPNARVQGVDVTIPKGGTISGTLADAAGEPIEGANVQVWQSRFVEGRTTLAPLTSARQRRTDDRGRYRLYGLLPGSYYVAATAAAGGRGGGRGRGGGPPDDPNAGARVFYPGTPLVVTAVALQSEAGQDADGVDITFNPGRPARVQGVARNSAGQPSQGRAYLAVSQRSGAPLLPLQSTGIGDNGAFEFRDVTPGDYVVQVIEGAGGGGAGGRGGRGQGGRGGDPAGGQGGGRGGNQGAGGGGGRGQAGGGQQAAAAGGRAAGVTQGAGAPGAAGGGGGRGGGQGGQQGRGGQAGATQPGGGGGRAFGQATQQRVNAQATPREFGTQFVTVGDGDNALVTIETSPGVRMTGRIVLEGDAGSTQASGFGLTAYPADADSSPLSGARTLRATVQSDGTFEMIDLMGSLRFGATRAPDGWWLKSVQVNGVNAALQPASFAKGSQATNDVTVVFANGTGAVEGRVLDDRRQPAAEFNVLVFSPDPDRWFSQSPYVKFGSPKQDGTFTVEGLPPADYLVAAVDRIEGGTDSGDWQNPAVLDALAAGAKRVRVGSGQRVTAELRLLTAGR